MRLLITIFCLIFITTVGITYAIVEESDAPFIYYFSPTERAIIIERADGADRSAIRLQGVIPDEHNVVYQISFSPTGNWLTWISAYTTSERNYLPTHTDNLRQQTVLGDGQAWIVSTTDLDNIQRITDLRGTRLTWSPTQDEIILTYVAHTPPTMNEPQSMMLIDANTMTQTPLNINLLGMEAPIWTADGQHILVESYLDYHITIDVDRDYSVNHEEWRQLYETPRLTTISNEGNIIQRHLEAKTFRGYFELPDGRLLYHSLESNTVVIEDLHSGDIVQLDPELSSIHNTRGLIWSPNKRQALFFGNTSTQKPSAWRLSIDDNSVIALDTWENWSPKINFYRDQDMFWAPSGDQILYVASDQTIQWFNINTMQTSQQGIENLPPLQSPDSSSFDAKWLADGQGIIMVNNSLWFYDLNTHTLSQSLLENRYRFEVSSSQRYLAVFRPCTAHQTNSHGKCIIDLSTQDMMEIPHYSYDLAFPQGIPSFLFYTNDEGNINWHSTEDWVIFGEDLETFPPHYSITHATGIVYRDFPRLVKPQWVPENVPLDDLH